MTIYSKDSPEYARNGHYKIDGNTWMSIWAYKKAKKLEPNTNSANAADSLLIGRATSSLTSKPDFGNFETVELFPLEKLESYYSR